jgi:cell division topological specificity factor
VSLFGFFARGRSGQHARERLQLLLAHERTSESRSDLVAILQQEILAVIARHVAVDRDQVVVRLGRGGEISTLEIDIEVPLDARKAH